MARQRYLIHYGVEGMKWGQNVAAKEDPVPDKKVNKKTTDKESKKAAYQKKINDLLESMKEVPYDSSISQLKETLKSKKWTDETLMGDSIKISRVKDLRNLNSSKRVVSSESKQAAKRKIEERLAAIEKKSNITKALRDAKKKKQIEALKQKIAALDKKK